MKYLVRATGRSSFKPFSRTKLRPMKLVKSVNLLKDTPVKRSW